MFEEDKNFVSFEDTDEDLIEVLRRLGILRHIERIEDLQERKTVLDQSIAELKRVLSTVNELPINKPQGKPSIKFRNKHYNLRKLLFTSLEFGASALVIAILPPLLPLTAPVVALALAPATISTISRLGEIVHKLTQDELVIFEAITRVIEEKSYKPLTVKKATRKDIDNFFEARKRQPPNNVDAILESLKSKNVISISLEPGNEVYYSIVP